MIATAYDPTHLVQMVLHVGAPITPTELASLVRGFDHLRADVEARPGETPTYIVIIETEHAPTATQRRRMAAAEATVPRMRQVFVTSSAAIRGILPGSAPQAPADAGRIRQTFATYAYSRGWLVANTGHDVEVFDLLHRRVRAEVQRAAVPPPNPS